MNALFADREKAGLLILRVTLALLICAHGFYRVLTGGVPALGAELTKFGLPLGMGLAVLVTASETVGALALARGVQAFALSVLFTLIYSAAIMIHHAQFGWFAAGADNNGCEYAVLLVIAFASQALANAPHFAKRANDPAAGVWRLGDMLVRVVGKPLRGESRAQQAFGMLMFTLSVLIAIHGWHRFLSGDWLEWGHVLAGRGYPCGVALAGGITALEAVGAPMFGMGILVFPLSLMFAALYTTAIFLHHLRSGWFMADGGKDGAEYAVLLVIAFLCTGWQFAPSRASLRRA